MRKRCFFYTQIPTVDIFPKSSYFWICKHWLKAKWCRLPSADKVFRKSLEQCVCNCHFDNCEGFLSFPSLTLDALTRECRLQMNKMPVHSDIWFALCLPWYTRAWICRLVHKSQQNPKMHEMSWILHTRVLNTGHLYRHPSIWCWYW